ncbi:MAG: hypothetical protein ABI629_22250 [bacterium]
MLTDARGLEVGSGSATALEAIDRFAVDFLAARDRAADIALVAEREPDCALAQLYTAVLHVYSTATDEIERQALPCLARARQASGNARERALTVAVAAWARGDFAAAIATFEQLCGQWPRDAVAAKFAEFLFFQAPDFRRQWRFTAHAAAHNDDLSAVHAMHAFGLEQVREYAAAERVAERALSLDADTPWAHHALLHCYLNQGLLEQGLAFSARAEPSWSDHTRPVAVHNVWHVALLHLAAGDVASALACYRRQIWGGQPQAAYEHIDAISLRWRIDLAGETSPDDWRTMLPFIAPRAVEQVFPFLNAHYAYALVRAGAHDVAAAALAALVAFADAQRGAAYDLWRGTGVPLVEGCMAFAAGEPTRAVVLMEPIMPRLFAVGGSDAQNDLFHQTYLAALLDAGQRAEAARLLRRRIGDRRPMPCEDRWLSRV